MPSKILPASRSVDLAARLGTAGEQAYVQLLSMLQDAQGIFALMVARSDFSTAEREAFLARLTDDLAPIPLCTVTLNRDQVHPLQGLIASAERLSDTGVVALIGLEATSGIGAIVGESRQRPPALAELNIADSTGLSGAASILSLEA